LRFDHAVAGGNLVSAAGSARRGGLAHVLPAQIRARAGDWRSRRWRRITSATASCRHLAADASDTGVEAISRTPVFTYRAEWLR
jgi:hypothetical protein